jgi:endonuclease/exonuclease/phosphatase family metal-dependent hydrolase
MDTFKIGTFNLFNLVLPNHPYYGNRRYSPDNYRKKLSFIAGQIDKMKADIVGLQEVFHPEALAEALNESNHLRKANFVVAAPTGDKGELPRVALASKYPILRHEVVELIPQLLDIEGIEIPIKTFSRPVLIADVQVRKDLVITCVVVHLKSKRPDLNDGESRSNPVELARGQARSLIRRSVEAAGLRQLLMKHLEGREYPVILLGDVNDSGLAVTSRMVSGEPPHRRMPHETKQQIWDVLLYHVRDIQARQSYGDFYYTHIHNGHYEALDHIMVSQELVRENRRNVGRVLYVSMLNDHLVDSTLSNDKMRTWHSDHGQVVATIEVREDK